MADPYEKEVRDTCKDAGLEPDSFYVIGKNVYAVNAEPKQNEIKALLLKLGINVLYQATYTDKKAQLKNKFVLKKNHLEIISKDEVSEDETELEKLARKVHDRNAAIRTLKNSRQVAMLQTYQTNNQEQHEKDEEEIIDED